MNADAGIPFRSIAAAIGTTPSEYGIAPDRKRDIRAFDVDAAMVQRQALRVAEIIFYGVVARPRRWCSRKP